MSTEPLCWRYPYAPGSVLPWMTIFLTFPNGANRKSLSSMEAPGGTNERIYPQNGYASGLDVRHMRNRICRIHQRLPTLLGSGNPFIGCIGSSRNICFEAMRPSEAPVTNPSASLDSAERSNKEENREYS